MKRIFISFSLVASLLSNAQFNNGGFEALNSFGLPQYWQGNMVVSSVHFDSLGVAHPDSLVFDGGANYLLNSADVHSGSHAIELRNAYNFTTSTSHPGAWMASTDSAAYGSFPLVLMELLQRPAAVSFWAKFLPVGTDEASLEIHVFDITENEIGSGLLAIGGTVSAYTYFNAPIIYTSTADAAFISIRFATVTPTSTATMGTRFLVDDVNIDFSAGIGDAFPDPAASIILFPDPASDEVTVRGDGILRTTGVRIYNSDGRLVFASAKPAAQIDVRALATGRYTVELATTAGIVRKPLVVMH